MCLYPSYNQICMHPQDKEKTTFITKDSNYYYKVMSFGLKNARVTYQRLVYKIFHNLIGWNIEIYLNDMVVKSNSCRQDALDLKKDILVLWAYNTRLNPEKCIFNVDGGKFLGFVLKHKRTKVNLDKFQAIIDIWSIKSLKELNNWWAY